MKTQGFRQNRCDHDELIKQIEIQTIRASASSTGEPVRTSPLPPRVGLRGRLNINLDDLADDLENYLRTTERAEELDAKIEQTDTLIDEIIYKLYELTGEEIAIVDDSDAKHKREQIETDLIGAHWLANTKAPRTSSDRDLGMSAVCTG